MATTPTKRLEDSLSAVPKKFRSRLITSYLEVKKRYLEARYDSAWDTSGLSAGKFCECALRLLQHELTGNSIPFGTHIKNFVDECNTLIRLPANGTLESLRIIIPRALVFIYTLRGKRGIGHIGGDVEANEIDSGVTVRTCDWIMCELIRIFHSLSLEQAQALVDALTQREIPDVWSIGGKKRILKRGLTYRDQTLLLLYSEPESGVLFEDIIAWTEHSNPSVFRRDVISKLHQQRYIEYDREAEIIYLSPTGAREVEDKVLKLLAEA